MYEVGVGRILVHIFDIEKGCVEIDIKNQIMLKTTLDLPKNAFGMQLMNKTIFIDTEKNELQFLNFQQNRIIKKPKINSANTLKHHLAVCEYNPELFLEWT